MVAFRLAFLGLLGASALLAGCATGPDRDPRDPLEPYNRAVYRFNTTFDDFVFKPVAKGYRAITPEPVDRGITNFFYNLADVTSMANNILQFKMSRAGSDLGRIFINTTVGGLGFVDVATNVGLPSYKEDFGQTLGYWGIGSGPYFVLPILGPKSFRDTVGFAGDTVTDPLYRVKDVATYWGFSVLRAVDRRADLLTAGDILDDAAIDPYSFMRDAYLQRRTNLVYDGNPPADEGKNDIWQDVDFGTGDQPAGGTDTSGQAKPKP